MKGCMQCSPVYGLKDILSVIFLLLHKWNPPQSDQKANAHPSELSQMLTVFIRLKDGLSPL